MNSMALFRRELFIAEQFLFFSNHMGWILVWHEMYLYVSTALYVLVFLHSFDVLKMWMN